MKNYLPLLLILLSCSQKKEPIKEVSTISKGLDSSYYKGNYDDGISEHDYEKDSISIKQDSTIAKLMRDIDNDNKIYLAKIDSILNDFKAKHPIK